MEHSSNVTKSSNCGWQQEFTRQYTSAFSATFYPPCPQGQSVRPQLLRNPPSINRIPAWTCWWRRGSVRRSPPTQSPHLGLRTRVLRRRRTRTAIGWWVAAAAQKWRLWPQPSELHATKRHGCNSLSLQTEMNTQLWAWAAHLLRCLGRLSLPPSEGQ